MTPPFDISGFRAFAVVVGLGWMAAANAQAFDWREGPVYHSVKEAQEARNAGQPVYRLDLTKNKLRTVPEEIAGWTELREVTLDRNRLRTLDVDLSGWENLVFFSAESNEIEAFPASIMQWDNLETLRLGDNLIDSIPLNIDRLTQLQTLSLWSNVIAFYPASLGDAPALRALDLQYNDMTAEEQDMLKSWLPERVDVQLSAPCRCDFDD